MLLQVTSPEAEYKSIGVDWYALKDLRDDDKTDILRFWEDARSCIHKWRTAGGRVRLNGCRWGSLGELPCAHSVTHVCALGRCLSTVRRASTGVGGW